MAGALFSHTPLQGQVNLLTTGAFDTPGDLLSTEQTRGVAFFSLGAPVGEHGDWTVKAALNQGDLSSWILTGNYVTRTGPAPDGVDFLPRQRAAEHLWGLDLAVEVAGRTASRYLVWLNKERTPVVACSKPILGT